MSKTEYSYCAHCDEKFSVNEDVCPICGHATEIVHPKTESDIAWEKFEMSLDM